MLVFMQLNCPKFCIIQMLLLPIFTALSKKEDKNKSSTSKQEKDKTISPVQPTNLEIVAKKALWFQTPTSTADPAN